MDEIWKDIPGYEGKYQISSTGEVKSLNYRGSNKSKLLKQRYDKNGYKEVRLSKNNISTSYRTHRLVAMVFIPNPNNLPMVNHIDECKSNNNVNNLEWCDAKYNNNYGSMKEHLKGEKSPLYGVKGKEHPKSKAILMYTKDGKFIRRFDSTAEACEYLGKKYLGNSINHCLKGKSKSAYGYVFQYEL